MGVMELIKRLRKRREWETMEDGYIRVEWEDEDAIDAADLLESYVKENEQLREALKSILNIGPSDGFGKLPISIAQDIASAALKGD